MIIETWLAFTAASLVLLVIPGPTILLVVSYALVASRARSVVRSPRAIGAINKVGGSLLIGAGIAAVATRAGQA